MMEAEQIAKGLTDEQRAALIACVDALSFFAGEGYGIAEDSMYDLAVAFNMDDNLSYEEWARAAIERKPHDR